MAHCKLELVLNGIYALFKIKLFVHSLWWPVVDKQLGGVFHIEGGDGPIH